MASTNFRQSLGHSFDKFLVENWLPHIPSEQEITFEDSNPTFESVVGNPETNPKSWYIVPNTEFVETRCITHYFAKLLGRLPIASTLPKRRATQRPLDQPNVLVDSIEDLVEADVGLLRGGVNK
jgi:hypothetical protein